MIGKRENYFIHDDYQIRTDPQAYDDRHCKDEWQREVYEYAQKVFYDHDYFNVVDVGCGSGYKLLKYFRPFKTIGVEIEPCLTYLRQTFPDRTWLDAGYLRNVFYLRNVVESFVDPDMVVCADVIEHLVEPDGFMESLAKIDPHVLVLATPDRDTLNNLCGPPRNLSHVREWNKEEFAAYVSEFFKIEDHFVDGSQIVLCVPR